jgi:hypothetical protein
VRASCEWQPSARNVAFGMITANRRLSIALCSRRDLPLLKAFKAAILKP